MSESKVCPKCAGNMSPGILQKVGQYGNSPYVWAPLDDAPFPMKGAPSARREIEVYRCAKCGYLELYAPPAS